jgi:hypothetical protein
MAFPQHGEVFYYYGQALHTDIYTHAWSPKGQKRRLKHSSETSTLYQNDSAMKHTAVVVGGKSIAVCLQSISCRRAVNPLLAFYDIDRRKREVLFWGIAGLLIKKIIFIIGVINFSTDIHLVIK